jgi:hypothetical protein
VAISSVLLAPHVNSLATNKPPKPIHGFAPTVENVSVLLMPYFGWVGTSGSTFKSKLWGPTKPVAHLGYAFFYSFLLPLYKKTARRDNGEMIEFDFDDYLTITETAVLAILETAENIRVILPELKQFRFKEGDLIEFVPV